MLSKPRFTQKNAFLEEGHSLRDISLMIEN